jgi:HKD family nuclease
MSASSVSVLLDQFTGHAETFRDRLCELIKAEDLESIRIAVAFARWDGIGLISEPLEGFLQRGGSLETVYGAGNGITTTDALYYGLVLKKLFPNQTYSGFVEDEFANAVFHPKYFEFSFASKTKVIVGSANLTAGGLQRNSEVGIEVTFPRGSASEKKFAMYWKEIRKRAKETTPSEIRRLSSQITGKERASEINGSTTPEGQVSKWTAAQKLE